MEEMNSVLFILGLASIIQTLRAHRVGARANESCYGHEILHPSTPPTRRQNCIGQCFFDFDLIDEVNPNDFTQRMHSDVSQTFALTCDSVYRCKFWNDHAITVAGQ